MANEKVQRDYQRELREKCKRFITESEEWERANAKDTATEIEVLYNFVRPLMLDSFKNGIQAGKRRAGGAPVRKR